MMFGAPASARAARGPPSTLAPPSPCFAAASEEGAPRWVFLGPPGVGKGTYAARVAEHVGIPHIAAGDLVRAEIKAGTAMGKQMKETVDRGSLLPDELVLELVQVTLGWLLGPLRPAGASARCRALWISPPMINVTFETRSARRSAWRRASAMGRGDSFWMGSRGPSGRRAPWKRRCPLRSR